MKKLIITILTGVILMGCTNSEPHTYQSRTPKTTLDVMIPNYKEDEEEGMKMYEDMFGRVVEYTLESSHQAIKMHRDSVRFATMFPNTNSISVGEPSIHGNVITQFIYRSSHYDGTMTAHIIQTNITEEHSFYRVTHFIFPSSTDAVKGIG